MLTTYRIRYERGEGVKFISHLDLMQLFSRAARRCSLPIAYSEGYNPRPQLIFGMPLPVGVTSEAEYVDIQLTVDLIESEIIQMLNDSMPLGIRIHEVHKLVNKTSNIMASVKASEYYVNVAMSKEGYAAIYEILESNKPLLAMKKSKSGIKETDIRQMVYEIEDKGEVTPGIRSIRIVTAAGNTMNLRPELAIDTLIQQAGIEAKVVKIHRSSLVIED